jgi:flagellin
MAVVINTNSSASYASLNLTKSSDLLQKSLARLSSGSKISTPSDDAGGLAVSMKLQAAIKRTDATATNVANALSFLQTQAGSLKSIASVLDRMSELGTLAGDVTKSATDIANYSTEFKNLVTELNKLSSDSFNGISLFSNAATGNVSDGSLSVFISQDGTQTMTLDQANVGNAWNGGVLTAGDSRITLNSLTSLNEATGIRIADVSASIQAISTLMANNGAQASRLQFALDSLNVNKVNLEAANSRIYDVDVAAETTKLARANILVQSGAAMLSQANAASQIALKLLQ